MISEIIMKNVATYKEVKIGELEKLNYFFGSNGSGKSTITNFLQSISEHNDKVLYPVCDQKDFNSDSEEILVFNQNFIENNFLKSDTLKGIFSLNKKNAEIDEKIKTNEKAIKDNDTKIKELQNENENLNKDRKKVKNSIHNKCFEKRNVFKSFSKIKLKHAGNKQNNFSEIKNILKTAPSAKPEFSVLNASYKKLYEEDLTKIDVLVNKNSFDDLVKKHNELSVLLNEVIIGKEDVQLAKLINEFGLKAWVMQGKTILEKTKNICPFCQKETIDADFISQLNDIFNESSKQKIEKIKIEKSNYKNLFDKILVNIQTVSEKYNVNNITSKLHIKVKEIYDENLKKIDAKLIAPNEKKKFDKIPDELKETISHINNEIAENNTFISSIASEKTSLEKDIWNYIALECKSDIENYENEDTEISAKIDTNSNEIKRLQSRLGELQSENTKWQTQTVNTAEAVKNINQILKNSGFMGFKICEKDTINNISQYYLSRTLEKDNKTTENKTFNTLSEGEKNFVSFLYFYQLCLGSTNIQKNSKKKIIVIDDPVSSMDSQVLFIVSTLINSLIEKDKTNKNDFLRNDIEQVFILTHNYYFYKEIAMVTRPLCKSQQHYLIEKDENNETNVKQQKKYKECDDYALMWQTIKQAKEKLTDENHEQNILLANVFRRILESYVNFMGIGDTVWKAISSDNDKNSAEHYLKAAFISMINDESHKVSPFDDLYFQKIHDANTSMLFKVFESIFDVIGKEHYVRMMGGSTDN